MTETKPLGDPVKGSEIRPPSPAPGTRRGWLPPIPEPRSLEPGRCPRSLQSSGLWQEVGRVSPARPSLRRPLSVPRTVVCNDPDMTLPPAALPPDTCRLRLERTAIRRVPAAAFVALRRLEQLWLPYNALGRLGARALRGLGRLRELRLPGNRLAAFPWASLGDAPRLRLLDLQANRLAAVPPGAARFLRDLTFLDLSSNRLLRLPPALLAAWAPLPAAPSLPGRPGLVLGKRGPCASGLCRTPHLSGL